MTRFHVGICSGEEGDDYIAGFTQATSGSTATCQTTLVVADAHSIAARITKFPTNTATSDTRAAITRTTPGPSAGVPTIFCFQGYSCASASPTTSIQLVCDSATTPLPCIKHNTSNKIEVYDAGGTLRATSTGTLSNSTAAATEWMVMLDTLTTGNMTIAIWIGRKLDTVVTTAIAHNTWWTGFGVFRWGDKTTGTARGADLYMTHMVYTYCDAAADSPLLKPWPSGYVVGGRYFQPNGDDLNEWTSGTAPTDHTKVVDTASPGSAPGNDGATTFVQSLVASQRFTVTWTAANPFVSTDTIYQVFGGGSGAIVSGGKVSAYMILRMNAASDTDSNLAAAFASTGYTGLKDVMNRPGGGSWAYTDFDRTAGVSNMSIGFRTFTVGEAGGASIGAKLTELPGPLVFYQPQGQWMEYYRQRQSIHIPLRQRQQQRGYHFFSQRPPAVVVVTSSRRRQGTLI